METYPTATPARRLYRRRRGFMAYSIEGRKGLWRIAERTKPARTAKGDREVIAEYVTTSAKGNTTRFVRLFRRIRTDAPKRGSDSMIIQRLQDGSLRVDFENGQVFSRRADGTELRLTEFEGRHGYKFVNIQHQGERKAIGVCRLVMMAAMNAEIPPGMDVNHIDGDITNNALRNLQVLSTSLNRSRTTNGLGF